MRKEERIMAEAARLKETYKRDVFPALQQKFGYKNVSEVPKLSKVTINMRLGMIEIGRASCRERV